MQEAERTASLLGGRYRLQARIGHGGMADVYRALDTRLDRVVAVKVFRPSADETGRARFEEEARLLAGLHHPGLVPVHDASASGRELFLVMQFVDGETLADMLRRGPLPPQRVLEIGRSLAEVLDYVHSSGVVHRDVKPSNVLLSRSGGIFLADFGISRLVDAVGQLTGSHIIGTASYMAPEQVRGSGISYPVDMYALGLVLLESLTGQIEYPGTGAEAAVARLSRSPHVPADLPEPLLSTLRAMTAEDPGQRPSAAQCATALSGGPTASLPTSRGTRLLPSAPVPERRRRRWWPWAAAALGLLAIVVAVVLVHQPRPVPQPPALPTVSGPAGTARLPTDLTNLQRMVGG